MTLYNEHGKKTYRMAWVVELSLFGMAICLAIFNLVTCWSNGDTTSIVTAFMLFAGWIGIACIELSTIPLAGSLAIIRWREKPLPFLAVICLTFLSAWTVYEFNEAASYFMTRGGREAIIDNEQDQKSISVMEQEIEQFKLSVIDKEGRADNARTLHEEDLSHIETQYATAKSKHESSYQENRSQLTDRMKRLRGEDLENQSTMEEIESLNQEIMEKQRKHDETIALQIANCQKQINDVKQKGIAEEGKHEETIALQIDDFQKQINATNEKVISEVKKHEETIALQIDDYKNLIESNNAEISRIDLQIPTIKTGPFTGGAEKRNKLQKEKDLLRQKNSELQDEIEGLYEERKNGPPAKAALGQKVSLLEEEIERLYESRKNGPSAKATLGQKVSLIEKEIERLYESRISGPPIANLLERIKELKTQADTNRKSIIGENKQKLADAERELRNLERAYAIQIVELNAKYSSNLKKANEIYDSTRLVLDGSQSESDTKIPVLNGEISEIQKKIADRTQTTEMELGSVLYYRMAKWFHEEDGLPGMQSYAKVQWYIFAPLGLFYSLTSIALAYTGIALRRPQPMPIKETRNAKKEHLLKQRLDVLQNQFTEQNLSLVRVKQEAFDAIKAVPQLVKLGANEPTRPTANASFIPWVACLLVALMGFGTIFANTAINKSENVTQLVTPKMINQINDESSEQFMRSVMDSVVVINRDDGRIGSGFFIDKKGIIATNSHVLHGMKEVNIITRDGRTMLGIIMEQDANTDLALIKVDGDNFPTVELGDASEMQLGSDVVAFGAPHGLPWSMSKGIVSNIRVVDGSLQIQTDAALNGGNSGGPLLHLKSGKVIGVNTWKVNDTISDGVAFAVGSQNLRSSFPKLEHLF